MDAAQLRHIRFPADGSAQFGGWGFRILPFIEGTAAYNGGGGATTDQCTINVIGAINKLFFCPLRRPPMAISGPSWYGPNGTYAHALCDYAASDRDETGILAYGNTGLVRRGYRWIQQHSDAR